MKRIINNKLSIINPKRGFTLVELLIYMGIFSALLFVLTDIFVATIDVGLESEATSAVEQDSRFILARLMYDINSAQSITTPASLGQQTSALQIVKDGVNYTYNLSSGNLQIINNNGTNTLNSFDTTISNLTFQRIGNSSATDPKDTIVVGFTITSITQRNKGPETKTIHTTIGIR